MAGGVHGIEVQGVVTVQAHHFAEQVQQQREISGREKQQYISGFDFAFAICAKPNHGHEWPPRGHGHHVEGNGDDPQPFPSQLDLRAYAKVQRPIIPPQSDRLKGSGGPRDEDEGEGEGGEDVFKREAREGQGVRASGGE